MSDGIRQFIVEEMADSLDVPDSAYEAAERRYEDLGEWLHDRAKAKCASFSPHVFPQGSFRLGTVTRPWKREDYDLDLACKLQEGLTKSTHTQEQLKQLVGFDLNGYRIERGIQEAPEEKHRCWRLNYQDQLKFHIDTVPGIPQSEDMRRVLQGRMISAGVAERLAQDIADSAMAITDNRDPNYRVITLDWNISNPEGYAKWFESRMRQAEQLLEFRAAQAKVAKVDDLPMYRWKTPLQRCIQILKRHRDIMFEKDPDGKPISVIMTTLAAWSYQGQADLNSAMEGIVAALGSFVKPLAPRVPNPVNPREDFADKWALDPGLEANFWRWLERVREDYGVLGQSEKVEVLAESALQKFGVHVDAANVRKRRGLFEKAVAITSGAAYTGANGTIGNTGIKNKPHDFYG